MIRKISLAEELIQRNMETREPFLDLGNCGLTDDSPELRMLEECSHLEGLNLGTEYYVNESTMKNTGNGGPGNNFTTLPVYMPPALKELQARNAGIKYISNTERLVELLLLDLSLNKIEKIEKLEPLLNLTELALHGNYINKIENIAFLKNLVNLHLSSNQIKKIEALGGLNKLKVLELNTNMIERIEGLDTLDSLFNLDLGNNKITKIEKIESLTELTYLKLHGNSIGRIENLDALTELNLLLLNYNQISKIENLDSLHKLILLDISSNSLTKIQNLDKLVSLVYLFLSTNEISEIKNLDSLPKLNSLYISNNLIDFIEPLVKVERLENVYLLGNPIIDCPADVWQSNDVKQIRAYFESKKSEELANVSKEQSIELEEVPVEIENADASDDELLKMVEMEYKEFVPPVTEFMVPVKDIKLIFLGNSNVGKTNLVNFLQTGGFMSTRNSTHGLEVKRWVPDPAKFPLLKNVNVNIWDFGGQEYYHEAYRLFLSANAVYSVLWEKDFDKNFRKETNITDTEKEILEFFSKEYWLDTVRFYGSDRKTAPLLLIQNKTDNQETDKQRISQELYNQYSLTECYHISLKEGTNPANPQQERILQNFVKDLEAVIAAAADKEAAIGVDWQLIRKAVVDCQEENPAPNKFRELLDKSEDVWISVKDFNQACIDILGKPLSDDNLYTIPRWLSNAGVVVYFDKNEKLNDKVFIDPRKLSQRIYDVLTKDILNNNGEFAKAAIKGSAEFVKTFIEVTRDLGLVFPHPLKCKDMNDPDYFIAPQYLPAEHAIEDLFKIASANAWQDSWWIKVPLFYYKKLLNYLVLKYTAESSTKARYFWKHGIVFIKNEKGKELRVMIKGLYPQENQHDGVILIGVENEEGKLQVQKEIFQSVLMYDANTGRENIPPAGLSKGIAQETIAMPVGTMLATLENKFLENLQISYDGENFGAFYKIRSMLEKNETDPKLQLYRFSTILPFAASARPPKKVFVSYSHQNTSWLNKLRIHLSGLKNSNLIEDWTDQEILAGDKWDKKIRDAMESADVFICLLSADFVASDYIWNVELKTIFNNLKQKNAKIIFVYTEPLDLGSIRDAKINDDLKETSILDFEIIPKDDNGYLKAVALWPNENLALATVVKKIREAVG